MAASPRSEGPGTTSDAGRHGPDAPRSAPVGYADAMVHHGLTRIVEHESETGSAALAAEVPVALVYNGRPHAVMMCTPADLEDFAVGFSITEGIARADEISRSDVVRYSRGIELQLEIPPGAAERLETRGRAMTGRTGCGLCGVEVITEALRETRVVRSAATFTRAALYRAGESLSGRQPLNRETSAIHAAAWVDADGTARVVREDVGRHNAVDKVIGALARSGTPANTGFLLVTSRASYELIQKAAVADIPLLAAVSRPTALAVQLAEDSGITLVGLLRGRSANVYTHPARISD